MKIIVNADDLGVSREVNDAVFQFMAERRVTSATLLANGEVVEDAAKRLKMFAHCSFGVHLNASGFRPLTTNPGLSPILDQAGCFAGNKLREIAITPSLREAIHGEWSAQVERVKSLGVQISHLDSHHHMHTVPGIFPVLKRLQRRFGIRKVRITMNIYSERVPVGWLHLARKALWNLALRHYYRTITTNGFTSLEMFLEAVKGLDGRHRTVELMVHPGVVGFEGETRKLSGKWWEGLPLQVEHINYNEL